MAYRMQTSVPDLTDISQESESTLALYGDQVKNAGSFANSGPHGTSYGGAWCTVCPAVPESLGYTQ